MAIYLVLYSKYIAIRRFFSTYCRLYVYRDLHGGLTSNINISNATVGSISHSQIQQTLSDDTSLQVNNSSKDTSFTQSFESQETQQAFLSPKNQNTSFSSHEEESFFAGQIETKNKFFVDDSWHEHLESSIMDSNGLSGHNDIVFVRNPHYFDRVTQLMDKPYFFIMQFFNSNYTWLVKTIHFLGFSKSEFCVLSPDALKSAQIDIKKTQLAKQYVTDWLVLLKAQSLGLIPLACESRYFVQEISQATVRFQIFYATQDILSRYSLHKGTRVFCLNPFMIFCSLSYFYQNLRRYTIVFQDKDSHALCHYADGLLEFCVVTERGDALQNYYGQIENLGEIFYCDFSNDPSLLCDFVSVETLLQMPLRDCLRMLALHHFYTKPIETNFYPRMFYSFIDKMRVILLGVIGIFAFYVMQFFYDKYQHNQFVQTQERQYQDSVDYQYDKKQNYRSMYDKMYESINKNASLNFCIAQDYRLVADRLEWIDIPCNEKND